MDTFTWTTFDTPDPGNKLFGIDVKDPNFSLTGRLQPGGAGAYGDMHLRALTWTICYLTEGGNEISLQVCEV